MRLTQTKAISTSETLVRKTLGITMNFLILETVLDCVNNISVLQTKAFRSEEGNAFNELSNSSTANKSREQMVQAVSLGKFVK